MNNLKIKCVIVDDEKLAREDLKEIVAGFPELIIEGEASSVSEASVLINKVKPDFIFLDIHLKAENGFDLLTKIDKSIKVVFLTAYDQYAIRAFEVNAQDYLLKPVSPERLEKTIEKICDGSDQTGITKLNYEDSVFLLLNHSYKFLRISNIKVISSAGDYTDILTKDGKKQLSSKSVKEWEERLPESQFCRIHRSTIVNLNEIEKVEEWFNHSYSVKIEGIEKPFIMSRNYASRIKRQLG